MTVNCIASASARLNIALNEKDNFKSELVPSGMKVTYPPAVQDLDFVNTRSLVTQEIIDFFGFGLNEEKNEVLRLFYGRILSQIMTVVFDVLYEVEDDDESDVGDDDDDDGKAMTSVRQTFNEQMKRRHDEDVEHEDFLDGDDGGGGGGGKMVKYKGKGKGKGKVKAKNEYGFGAKMDIYLKSYASMFYPLAKQMKEQKIIDDYEFYNKFPLALQIDSQKEQQKMAEQQMKLNKESMDAKMELEKKTINNEIAVNNQTLKLQQQKQQQQQTQQKKTSNTNKKIKTSSS